MRLFQLLQTLDPNVAPEICKIHLAVWNGQQKPLDVYLAGDFEEWQSWQRRRNFERKLVVSLVQLPQPDRWLFAGVYDSLGRVESEGGYQYKLVRRHGLDELDGRLVVSFRRSGRQSYLLGEPWADALGVAEIRPDRLRVSEFRGYSWAMLTKQDLDIVVRQSVDSWRAALGAVSGIYVIADRHTGKLYVGSATAGEGIWSRWCAYAATGHGGNQELAELLDREGPDYAQYFQFGVLETADSRASKEDVLVRESYWKELLQTRKHGYNSN
jgi:hypothetical protein